MKKPAPDTFIVIDYQHDFTHAPLSEADKARMTELLRAVNKMLEQRPVKVLLVPEPSRFRPMSELEQRIRGLYAQGDQQITGSPDSH